MAGVMCYGSSVLRMASGRGGMWQQHRQCIRLLHQLVKAPSGSSLVPAFPRYASNASLPERYVPKSGSQKGAERESGVSESRDTHSHNSDLRRLPTDRSLVGRGEGDAEGRRVSRSSSAARASEKANYLISRPEGEEVEGFERRKPRRRNLQQPSANEATQFEGLFGDSADVCSNSFTSSQTRDTGKREQTHDLEFRAKDYCISLLALGPQPEAKLRMKMSKKNFSAEIMDAAIVELQRCGLQSDQEYAEVFARSRWNGNAWGPKRIKYELLRRGISKDNVEAGLMHVFQNEEDAGDLDGEDNGGDKWGMNQKAAEQLLSQARRRWSQGNKADINARKRRMAGWLQRRGFGWDITSDLLRILQREDQEEGEDNEELD
ncbi:regulatory protein [Marchantia polymorpha subsp. ruderalis]|uniref:Regulatory protein RecX n=2 Tax=Marchantia polymorpha TaxID=3197 RepID=A0AAF6BS01_MARPO|nr:hypothetical protein MARPO_0047s0103 [Marchantia polymorpha]BBN14785.1 hypothetical protein Mp_6g14490 [Marchantia polymorpha subsp. ruderalis]|eukprot:PTQ39129.1 hypothetical protein MARPO_0047s0103 [Marchantia polymorpha]